jgi:hypothetical protein
MTFEFPFAVSDMVDTQDDVVIASGNSLYRWSRDYEDDNGEPIEQVLETKEYTSSRQLFTRKIDVGLEGVLGGVVDMRWANKSIKYIIKKPRRVINAFSVCRESSFKLSAINKTEIEYIKMYYFEN